MDGCDEIYARIESPTVKLACDDLRAYFAGRDDFTPKPRTSAPEKSMHYAWQGKDIHAFIANLNWLLWYFRKPGTTVGAFTFVSVLNAVPDARFTKRSDPSKREVTIKITNPAEARAILEYVHRHPQPV